MGRRYDHGHPAGDVLEHRIHHLLALGIRQHELLGKIGQNADAVGAGVDHKVDAAPLTVEIEFAAFIEDGRCDGKHTAIGSSGDRSHDGSYLRWL